MAVQGSAPPLLGRLREQETLRQLLANVRDGQSAVLVVRGEAGIGKTALLRYLADQASGVTVARAVGVESEMELPFAGLHQLCAPMLGRLGSLAEPQRRGLSVAFGLAAGDTPDRFLVALAVLSLMAESSGERPLLCVVDDAQWLDQASAQVLGVVGRRLLAESVALVFAARTPSGEASSLDHLAGLPELQLEGLGNEAARALLATVAPGPLDESVRVRIIEETRGNPLALLELNRGLGAAELAGGFALPHAGDLPRRIENQYIERLGELPPEAQRMALLAAADPVGDAALVFRAARLLGLEAGAANPAVAAGLLSVGANVRFRHPLVRSAVYRAAAARDRRAAHGALAAATDPGTDPDRRAWHRAHATAGPDETVAGELIGSAGRALRRGGVAAAAAFWERAVVLTPDPAERAARALEAAGAKYAAGDFEAAQALLAAAEVGPLNELSHALVQRMRAQVAFALRRGSDAPPLLLRAAQRLEDLDAGLARQTYLEALVAAVYVGRLARGQDVLEIARAAGAVSAGAVSAGEGSAADDLLLRGLAVRLADGYPAAAPLLSEALRRYRARPQELDWLCVACNLVAMDLWDDQAWFELATGQVRLARANGTLSWLPFALEYLAEIQIQAGELSAATALLAEGERIDPGIRAATLPYVPLLLAAWRGDAPAAAELAEQMVQGAHDRGEGAALTVAEYARAVLYNGLGDYRLALDAADRASAAGELVISPWALYELVEAAVRSDERERAAEAAGQLSEIAAASGTDWARGAAARSRALLAGPNAADELYGEALERLARTRMATHLARTQLCYGEWLRRQSRRIEARSQLRPAYEAFESMGAQGFAERARRELLATGEKVRRRGEDTRADLTPQEAEIAQLARDGLTNPEIGAQLFIGARTVEWHLRKVFAKLDIGSRRELDEALRRRDRPGPGARVPARDLTGATGRPGERSCGHDHHTCPIGTDFRRDRRQRRHRAGDRPPGSRRGRRRHPDRTQPRAPRARRDLRHRRWPAARLRQGVTAVNDLLKLAIAGHGGLRRWEQLARFRVAASITGAIWALKGRPGLLDGVVLAGETRDQRLIITPFPRPGRYATWEPYRQTIETADGVLVAERRDPAAAFAGTTRSAPWDELQAAYFAGEANWNYCVAPFLFARRDFNTEEAEPWHEDGQTWRSLLVTYPDAIVAHTRQQTYYFDEDGLLRRLDYSVDILGGGPAVHYPSRYREFDGIMVPTRRRVYVRNPDGTPVRDPVSVAIEITNVAFG